MSRKSSSSEQRARRSAAEPVVPEDMIGIFEDLEASSNQPRPKLHRKGYYHSASKKPPRARWTDDMDRLLLEKAKEHNYLNWNLIAEHFPGKTGKQCRFRWFNYLREDLRHDPWSGEEDVNLVKAVLEMGASWAKLTELPEFKGRSPNMLKNRYHVLQARVRRIKEDGPASENSKAARNKRKTPEPLASTPRSKAAATKRSRTTQRAVKKAKVTDSIDADAGSLPPSVDAVDDIIESVHATTYSTSTRSPSLRRTRTRLPAKLDITEDAGDASDTASEASDTIEVFELPVRRRSARLRPHSQPQETCDAEMPEILYQMKRDSSQPSLPAEDGLRLFSRLKSTPKLSNAGVQLSEPQYHQLRSAQHQLLSASPPIMPLPQLGSSLGSSSAFGRTDSFGALGSSYREEFSQNQLFASQGSPGAFPSSPPLSQESMGGTPTAGSGSLTLALLRRPRPHHATTSPSTSASFGIRSGSTSDIGFGSQEAGMVGFGATLGSSGKVALSHMAGGSLLARQESVEQLSAYAAMSHLPPGVTSQLSRYPSRSSQQNLSQSNILLDGGLARNDSMPSSLGRLDSRMFNV